MAAPTFTKNPTQVKTGPGLILVNFSLAGTLPDLSVVAGSKFTDPWTGWGKIGFSDNGVTITFRREVEDVPVAESLFPIKRVPTSAGVNVAFDASGINEDNVKLANAGGTWTVSGTGDTQSSKYDPPDPEDMTRVMLGFLSAEEDEAFVWYQTFQSGEVTMERNKGAAKASLRGMSFETEEPDPAVSAKPWNYWYAGTWADAIT